MHSLRQVERNHCSLPHCLENGVVDQEGPGTESISQTGAYGTEEETGRQRKRERAGRHCSVEHGYEMLTIQLTYVTGPTSLSYRDTW